MSFRRLIPAVLATLWLSAGSAVADGIMVTDAFARASAGAAKNGAAFMTLKNHAGRDDHLVAVRTARARKAELHTHIHDQGVMRMRPVARITVPAGAVAALKPGGNHVMLMGLTAPLKEGETLSITLVFEHAGEIAVAVPVGAIGARGPAASGDHHNHGGGHHKQ